MAKRNNYPKSILDLAPNFRSGIASIFSFGRNREIYDALLHRTAYDGLCSDWYAIGNALRRAMNKFDEENSWKEE